MSSFSFVKKHKQGGENQKAQKLEEKTGIPNSQSHPKTGFSFIKKAHNKDIHQSNQNSTSNQNNIGQTFLPQQIDQKPQNKPLTSLDSLLTDDLLSITPKQPSAQPQQNETQKEEINLNTNNSGLFANLNSESFMQNQNEVKPQNDTFSFINKQKSNTSTEKKGFSFVKKKKENTSPSQSSNSLLSPIPKSKEILTSTVSCNNETNNNNNILSNLDEGHSLNLNIQEEEIPQSRNDNQSEDNFSVSSKNKTKSELKVDTSPQNSFDIPQKQFESQQNHQYQIQSSSAITKESIEADQKKKKIIKKNSYLNYISNMHCLKLKLQSKNVELENLQIDQDKLTHDEQAAIEANDFEAADRIETTIKEISEKIKKVNSTISQCKQDIIAAREKELSMLKNSNKETELVVLDYKKLQRIFQDKIEQFNSNEYTKHKSENIRLTKMNEKLEFLQSNLTNEKNYIDTEETKINELIKGQSKDIFDQLDELNQKKKGLNLEIEELKKQLEAKEAEMDELNSQIQTKEIEIDAIKSNFNHEFGKIEMRKKNYQENLKDYNDQQAAYLKKVEDYNNKDIEYEKYLVQMKNEVTECENKIDSLKNEILNEEDSIQKKESLLNKEVDIFNQITNDINLFDNLKKKIQTHKEDIQSLKVSIKLMQGEITQIEIKLPALEEEKKGFVQRKNFKEAGRVSHELKASLEKKKNNAELIEKNNNKISDLEVEVTNFEQDAQQILATKKEHEKELNIAIYEHLINYFKTIKSYEEDKTENADLISEIETTQNEILKLEELDYIKDKSLQENVEMNGLNSDKAIKKEDLENILGANEANSTEKNNIVKEEIQTKEEKEQPKLTKEEIKKKIETLNPQIEEAAKNDDFENAQKLQEELDQLTAQLNEE